MSPSGRELLRHTLDEADYLLRTAVAVDRERFVSDETLRRAFVRSLEIVGEAAKQVPDAVRRELPDVEWRAMSGMRDRLIHGYFGVDYDLSMGTSSRRRSRRSGWRSRLLCVTSPTDK
jgi:uncharacterized protein with HEPN domain